MSDRYRPLAVYTSRVRKGERPGIKAPGLPIAPARHARADLLIEVSCLSIAGFADAQVERHEGTPLLP
jgi:hypothetical protein